MTDTITIDVRALYDRAVANLQPSYDFGYVHYDDALSDEQIARALGDGYDELRIELADRWRDAAIRHDVRCAIRDAARTSRLEFEALYASDYWHELVELILERDEGDPWPALVRNRGNVLLRYRLGNPDDDQDLPYGLGYPADVETAHARVVERHARRLARLAGLRYDDGDNAARFRQLVIEQAYYGGNLHLIWYGPVGELLDHRELVERQRAGGDRAPRRVIRWSDPHLVLLDQWNGSGHCEQFTGTVSKILDLARVHVDRAEHYGWDACAGLHLPAFDTPVTIGTGRARGRR